MLFLLSLSSMLGYAVQNAVLVRFARELDGMSLAFYRNISFLLTLSPLLLFAEPGDISYVLSQWHILLAAGICGGIFLSLHFLCYRFLPIGVSHGVVNPSHLILIILLSWFVLEETFSWLTLCLMSITLLGAFALTALHTHMDHLDKRFALGIGLCLLSAVPLATTKFLYGLLTKTGNPMVAGYFWEICIGLATLLLIFMRKILYKKSIQYVTPKTFMKIALCSAPTLIGTGCMGLAMSIGSIGLSNTIIGTGGIFATTLISHWMYDEKLKPSQYAALAIIALGIVGLKFVS